MVADPHHFNADPDATFHFNADPDLAPKQSEANLQPLVYRPGSILSLYAYIVRVHGPPRLHLSL
jgi:hypothetical protein